MKYIGNIPEQNIIITNQDRYDYVSPENPTIDVNPSTLYATWLNMTTGELFVCILNLVNENTWVGQKLGFVGFEVLLDTDMANEGDLLAINGGSAAIASSGTYEGTVGFDFIGRPNSSPQVAADQIRWEDSIDLTRWNSIAFHVVKVHDHGVVNCLVMETGTFNVVAEERASYGDLPLGEFVELVVDVSSLGGFYDVSFQGGYTDSTGDSLSETIISNIRFRVEGK